MSVGSIPPTVEGERVASTLRFRLGVRRAVDEMAVMLGGLSREETVHVLLVEGLTAAYARLGLDRDPAATAAYLLHTVAETWGSDLSDDERAAFEVTAKALERITQVRARQMKTQEATDDRS
jgi:hypothetical protein